MPSGQLNGKPLKTPEEKRKYGIYKKYLLNTQDDLESDIRNLLTWQQRILEVMAVNVGMK